MDQEVEDKFERIAKLGEGAFGKVYLCKKVTSVADKENGGSASGNISYEQKEPEKPEGSSISSTKFYALKKLKPLSKASSGETIREAHIMNELNSGHPNLMALREIVQKDKGFEIDSYLVLDFGIEVMEFFAHKEVQLSNSLLRNIARQIVHGLK